METKPEGPRAPEEIVVRRAGYEIATALVGPFLVVRLRGRYSDELLDDLRNRVFMARSSFAVDASALEGMTAAFARELLYTADLLRGTDQRIVLLNPPPTLKSLLSLVSTKSSLGVFTSEAQLAGGGRELDRHALHAAHELERIQNDFKTDRRWQFADREGCWLCPFCAEVQKDVHVPSVLSLGAAAAEKVYRHLWEKCTRFAPASPQPQSLEALEAALRRANQDKIVLTKRQVSALEDKARQADALADSVKIASDRQRRLLPARPPDMPGTEIEIVYRPAEQLSGDFYDFVPLRDGRLGFIIGDVSGHGIEAGILMGMAKKVLSIRLEETGDPFVAVLLANKDLFRDLDRVSFVTAFVSLYTPATKTLSFVRAGHNPPLIFNRERSPAHVLLQPSGTGLGLSRDQEFQKAIEEQSVGILPGDLLLCYTDGVVEARNADNDEFSMRRLLTTLEGSAGARPGAVLSALCFELDHFTAGRPAEDDVTAVCVRFS